MRHPQRLRHAKMQQMRRTKPKVNTLPNPKNPAEKASFLEAAKTYRAHALKQKDTHKKRRFLNFAARYYEAAGEYSLATKCFLASDDVERALGSAVKAKNPKIFSNAFLEAGHEKDETARLLLTEAVELVDSEELIDARTFAKEVYELNRSVLAEALMMLVDGYMEGKDEKITLSVKSTRVLAESDPLAREINFVANKFLAKMPKPPSDVKAIPTRCPECGAPLPLKKKGKILECEYCGFLAKLN
jgi:hypothetical protein